MLCLFTDVSDGRFHNVLPGCVREGITALEVYRVTDPYRDFEMEKREEVTFVLLLLLPFLFLPEITLQWGKSRADAL
jgi:hypothetical protein